MVCFEWKESANYSPSYAGCRKWLPNGFPLYLLVKEATVSSASFEFKMQWEGIQLHSWNILLTVEQVETLISFIIMYMMSVQSNMA